jgi:hypothetical protein
MRKILTRVVSVMGYGICGPCSQNRHSGCTGNCHCYCQA